MSSSFLLQALRFRRVCLLLLFFDFSDHVTHPFHFSLVLATEPGLPMEQNPYKFLQG